MRLAVDDEDYDKIKKELAEHGIETDDSAELVLSKANSFVDRLIVKDEVTNERVVVPCESIIYIDSYGHSVEVHTKDNIYQANERIYKILQQLDNNEFLRISNSVIVSKSHIKKISPTLSMKFILTLSNADRVDVTRSYYYTFKEAFNI